MNDPASAIGVSIVAMLLVTLVLQRFKLPFVLGVLLAGVLMGPFSPLAGVELGPVHFSDYLVTDTETLNMFAEIGAILILFEIGIEFSVQRIAKLGFLPILASFTKIGIVFFMAYEVAIIFLGFPVQAALFLGVIISMSSTPLIVKLLAARAAAGRPEVPLITAMLIMEDIFAMFALSILLSMGAGQSIDEVEVAVTILKTGIAFLFVYFVLTKVLKFLAPLITSSEETLLFSALVISVGIGWATQNVGLSAAIGAFLAGSVLSGLPEGRKVHESIRPFGFLFSALFFFSIGMLVDIQSIFNYWELALLFTIIAIIGKFSSASVSAYLAGLGGKGAVFVGVSMLTLSEVSLLVAREGNKLNMVSIDVLSVSSAVLFISVFLSSVLMPYTNEMYFIFKAILPSQVVDTGRSISRGIGVLRRDTGTTPQVHHAVPVFVSVETRSAYSHVFKRTIKALQYFIVSLGMVLFAVLIVNMTFPFSFAVLILVEAIAIVSLLASLFQVKKILDEATRLILNLRGASGVSFIVDLAFAIVFLLVALYSPLIGSTTNMPFVSLIVVGIAFPLAAYYLWDASKKASVMFGPIQQVPEVAWLKTVRTRVMKIKKRAHRKRDKLLRSVRKRV